MKRKLIALAAGGMATAMILSACSSGSDRDGDAEALPNTAWLEADYDDLIDGGTVTLAVNNFPDNWNRNHINGNQGDTTTILGPVHNIVGINYTAEGEWFPDPNYIVSAEVTNEDPQQITVTLNPDAVWNVDGEPVPITIDDFVATWEALNGSSEGYEITSAAGFRDISDVEQGEDEFQYIITYENVNADWPNYIYPSFPAEVAADADTFNTGYLTEPIPGNGPFIIESIDETGGVIVQVPNPLWWGPEPKLDRVVFRQIEQDGLAQAFANDEIDVLDTQASPDTLITAEGRADAVIQRSLGLTWTHLTINGADGHLADVNVRQAIAFASKRDEMVDIAQGDLGVPPTVVNDYVFMPGQAGYTEFFAEKYPYDPDAAAEKLEEAGYELNDDGIWEKDGDTLSFQIVAPSGISTNIQRAELFMADLNEVGFDVSVNEVPVADYFENHVLVGNYEAASFSWEGTPWPIVTAQNLYNPVDSLQNFTGITDDRLGDLWRQANAELDPDARLELVAEINDVISDYVPVIPLGATPEIWAVKEGLANIGAAQFQAVDWSVVGFVETD